MEDDSGIPESYFDGAWKLQHYSGPITLFANRYQPKLTQLSTPRRSPSASATSHAAHDDSAIEPPFTAITRPSYDLTLAGLERVIVP